MLRRLRLLVLATLCAAAAALAVPVYSQAATVTPQQLYDLTAENPYIHTDIGGRRWVYGAASTHNTGNRTMRAVITQYYGGDWHVVGYDKVVSGAGDQRAIASVLCTGGATPYSFRTVGQVRYGDRWYPVFSAPVTLGC